LRQAYGYWQDQPGSIRREDDEHLPKDETRQLNLNAKQSLNILGKLSEAEATES
jgi:hypothetical protein